MSMDGAKAGARREAYRKIHTTCACGRRLEGNFAVSHLRTCETNLRENGWPIEDGMKQALMQEYRSSGYVQILRAVELKLGQLYLARRASGDKTALPWREHRDTIWVFADEAANQLRKEASQ
jgi:hypothetical protein